MKSYIPKSWRSFAKRLEPSKTASEPLKAKDLGAIGQAVCDPKRSGRLVQSFYNRLHETGQTVFTLQEIGSACGVDQNVPSGSKELRAVIVALMLAGRIVPGQRGRGDGTPVADQVNAMATDLDL